MTPNRKVLCWCGAELLVGDWVQHKRTWRHRWDMGLRLLGDAWSTVIGRRE